MLNENQEKKKNEGDVGKRVEVVVVEKENKSARVVNPRERTNQNSLNAIPWTQSKSNRMDVSVCGAFACVVEHQSVFHASLWGSKECGRHASSKVDTVLHVRSAECVVCFLPEPQQSLIGSESPFLRLSKPAGDLSEGMGDFH